jgi:serine/threonine protein kinase/Tol biopolymer transport system component
MAMIGKSLAHYEITRQLGKGGMGVVYRAKDQKLGRDVAIKVLPEEFARDTDRIARFQREAKLLASLNHPNIAAIHGLEESGGTNFLVMELIEGDTLADRIKAGAVPVEEALKLALQIAEALEAAHEKGVIHRDLKPANIKVTPDGKVKVLDFGLAKAFAGEKEQMNLSNSPTLSDAVTQQGVILGTAAYMSPEQARGKAVDKRADIWAFGCVLFEMLTGRAAFSGGDVTDILAAVIRAEPEWSNLPAKLHGRLREALERCLKKELKDRYHDISDVRADIQKVLTDPSGVLVQPVATTVPQSKFRKMAPWIVAVLGIVIVGVAVWMLRPQEPRQTMRFQYELPEGQQFGTLDLPAMAVSPDGKQFVYSTTNGLYLRSVNELTVRLIAGTEENTQQPFFSPDGKWIGYFSATDRKLKKIAVAGGAPTPLCAVPQMVGASWGSDNTIVYGQLSPAIMRISANGGTPEILIEAKSGALIFPQILPDGESVLYTAAASVTQMSVMVQSLKSGESKELFSGMNGYYIRTGHIIFSLSDNDSIFAVPFDPDRLEVTGGQVPVVDGVKQCAVSDAGTLAYIPGTSSGEPFSGRTLMWVNREGKEEPLEVPSKNYMNPKISPDGTRVAVTINGRNTDIWIWDLIRKALIRLTDDEKREAVPIWTPDSRRIIFALGAGPNTSICCKAADGTGRVEQLAWLPGEELLPCSMSSDGKILLTNEVRQSTKWDIGMLSMEGDHTRKLLIQNDKFEEAQAQISPDGRFIAYSSNESTGVTMKTEVFVRPFPEVDNSKWQISTNGGSSPLWSPDGRELFYRSSDNSAMAVAVETKPTISFGTPETLFRSTNVHIGPGEGTTWDIHPDGKRFLMMKRAAASTSSSEASRQKINIVLNWFEELKQLVPVP